MNSAELSSDASQPRPRWFHLSAGRCLAALLAIEVALFVADWLYWLPKGWAVLIAVAACTLTVLLLVLRLAAALVLRWRFQFSMRAMLILTVAIAIACSWLATAMGYARKQRMAIQTLRGFPGVISYDDRYLGRRISAPEPEWLLRLLDEDFFANVESVCLGASGRFTNVEMAHIATFRRVKELHLLNAAIDDSGLTYLRGAIHLETLELTNTRITDRGLAQIKDLKQLWHLELDGAKITDAGLDCLSGLGQLASLSLDTTAVTDAGIERLQRLTGLKRLSLKNTRITVEGAKRLRQALPDCTIDY